MIAPAATKRRIVRKGPRVEDEELFLKFRESRNRDFFTELVRRYERELFAYLRRYLGNSEMAEDVFQATFMQVYLKRDHFEEGRRFRPWLYAIATNQAIDSQRKSRRHRMASIDRSQSGGGEDEAGQLLHLLASDEQSPDSSVMTEESRAWVQKSLGELSDQMRQVVELVYYQGLKYREAAEALDVPVGTVKSRMNAAITRLNQFWQKSHVDNA
jgi:RNA polymerase sigma-70 factor (ECF subfamily)